MVDIFDREKEREYINCAISDIHSGVPLALRIEGASGVGKTQLMHYLTANLKVKVIPFYSSYDHYKCSPQRSEAQFSCVSAMLVSLENQFPKIFFQHIEKYVTRYSNISVINALAEIIPGLNFFKWSASAIKRANKRPTELYDNLSGHLVNNHLLVCISEVASQVIQKAYSNNPVVVIIDDIVWLDDLSLHSLFGIYKRLEKTSSPMRRFSR